MLAWSTTVRTPNDMPAPNKRLATRVAPPGDQFVVVQLPNGEERLEPVVDLSPNGLAILLRAQRPEIQPGTRLPRLRLFTQGECTLETTASVREVTQVSTDGALAWKIGLRLDQAVESAPSR